MNKIKRVLASILVLVMIVISIINNISFKSYGLGNVKFINEGNIWKGDSKELLGHNRNYLFKWKVGNKYTFCIEEGKHMGRDVRASEIEYKISDENIPYISDRDMFINLALIGNWVEKEKNNQLKDVEYAAAQLSVWAVMRNDLDLVRKLALKIEENISGNLAKAVEDLLEYIKTIKEEKNLVKGIYFNEEEAIHNRINMENVDGEYILKIDISNNKELRNLYFSGIEGMVQSINENEIVLTYKGSGTPRGMLKAKVPSDLENLNIDTGRLKIYIPDNRKKDQAMISASMSSDNSAYLNIGGFKHEAETEVEIYRHKERFKSTYNIELEKFDYETRKALENVSFEILRNFDFKQLKEGDKSLLDIENISPKLIKTDKFISLLERISDENGRFTHSDKMYYDYEKIYVVHPQPEYLEIEENEEVSKEEIEAKKKENERLKKAYDDIVSICEEKGYFHADDIDTARLEMLEDRNRTYQAFIDLRYRYTLREIRAREGYILHTRHNDDEKIEVISTNSSQAGAESIVEHIEDIDIEEDTIRSFSILSNLNKNEIQNFNEDEEFELDFENIIEDDVEILEEGDATKVSYIFQVYNNRTEGEVHISKRDLELYKKDSTNSYKKTQGDATLEGAVYGLYANMDIVHPDGKTGLVYKKDELVSIATTDKNGDASFLVFTEESENSLLKGNKYGTWVGRPLILGSYYVKEIARSEGYELSVVGKSQKATNRKESLSNESLLQAGEVSVSALNHSIDEHDGSTNDSTIRYYKTYNGFKVFVSSYPKGTKFYKVNKKEEKTLKRVVRDKYFDIKKDELGNIEYKKALGGELKFDLNGNPIEIENNDSKEYEVENLYIIPRLDFYSKDDFSFDDNEKWEESVDENYLKIEINKLLKDAGYKSVADYHIVKGVELKFESSTNKELVDNILNYIKENSFYDSVSILDIEKDEEVYKVKLVLDYTLQKRSAIFEEKSKSIYVKKEYELGDGKKAHTWIEYKDGEYILNSSTASVSPKKVIEDRPSSNFNLDDYIKPVFKKAYQRYEENEELLDFYGNKTPQMEEKYVYEDIEETIYKEELEEIKNFEYDEETKVYTLNFENDVEWDENSSYSEFVLRLETGEKSIEVDGKELLYSDYLLKIKGAGLSAFANSSKLKDDDTYIEEVNLLYEGQMKVFSDANTRNNKIKLLQRVIKQAIKVTKSIARASYRENNTFRKHKDPFTILFGGYKSREKEYIKGFKFKIYLVSDLERENLLTKKVDGTYDYKKLFDDESKKEKLDTLAIDWEKEENDLDNDLKTLSASYGSSKEAYFGTSIPLSYGKYVIVEEVPTDLVNKHYEIDEAREIEIPFVPSIDENGNIYEDIGSSDYIYYSDYTAKILEERFKIRLNEEVDMINAHSNDGDFKVFKYGLKKNLFDLPYENEEIGKRYTYAESENLDSLNSVYYEREYDKNSRVINYGVTKDDVKVLKGKSLLIDGKYAKALVPYSILEPKDGDRSFSEDKKFSFVAFLKEHFENTFYSSKLRIEKVDAETNENIIHDGALFKIYLAKRDIVASSLNKLKGTGEVLFEEINISGTREELEKRADVDNISWNEDEKLYTGSITKPIYDENEQVFIKNEFGNEIGLFKAYSTEKEVLKEDGSIVKENVGYIETFKPLGAGTYVLVEVKAPRGYAKSKPIAFEVYKNGVNYYEDGEKTKKVKSKKYQYANEIDNKTTYVDMARIVVKDKPSTLRIHKVEDGDNIIGDENEIKKLSLNDKGDLLTYIVKGKLEYLSKRGDVEDITFNKNEKIYVGKAKKTFDKFSESIVKVDENTALLTPNMKALYEKDTRNYSSYAIKFDKYVEDARLRLYEGVELEPLESNSYKDVRVIKENGKTKKIIFSSGTHSNLLKVNKNKKEEFIYDVKEVPKEEIELYFYDLDSTRILQKDGETFVLDERGNKVSYVDVYSGLAYTKDDYGKIIAYKSENGKKKVAKSIVINKNSNNKDSIYKNLETVIDENSLTKYYTNGSVTYKDEEWQTEDKYHEIKRLDFGAYIIEEVITPYEKGYIKAMDRAFILRESKEIQDFFYDNEFTKINIAKIDATTKREIKNARMTLYKAISDENNQEILKKGEIYTSWISGYEYNDDNELKFENNEKIETSLPHWIDHIPVGKYILEESEVPYEDGYVKSFDIVLDVKEVADVQTFYMEDDYTALEIKKYDTKNKEVLSKENSARLALYKANLDEENRPIKKLIKDDVLGDIEVPTYDKENLVLVFNTSDGIDVKETKREINDEYGESYTKYEYNKIKIPSLNKGEYYVNEKGHTRFNYLPVGYYVLVEEEAPRGYASAKDILIQIEDIGSKEKIHECFMGDTPINVEIYKESLNIDGDKKIVKNARLSIYEIDENNEKIGEAVYSFITGSDGKFSEEDSLNGLIPKNYKVGDLKPHLIEYMKVGRYILVEEETPFGFLKSDELIFEIVDTEKRQEVHMYDEIPKGKLNIIKRDSESDELLENASFIYKNKTLDKELEILITNEEGKARVKEDFYIGYVDEEGLFKAFTYEVKEVNAPKGYILNNLAHEFEYEYKNEVNKKIVYTYDALNDINQVKISKKELTGKEELAGASLKVYDKKSKKIIDEWISKKQAHYIKGLKEGTYILEEIAVPNGNYAKAESIEFEISKNMTSIPYIEMFDDHSKVIIRKIDGDSNKELLGARLLLKNLEGKVLYEWTSSSEAHKINGIKAGTYIISEEKAPEGYEKASDMRIEIKDTLKEQEFIFKNYSLDTYRNIPKKYISFKKVDENYMPLKGVEFSFYRKDGSLLTKAESDENGLIRIERPENGIYTFRETKVLEGFYENTKIYTLEVDENSIRADFNLVNIPFREIELIKKDKDKDFVLEGAVFEIVEPFGNKFKIKSDENGLVKFVATNFGEYKIREIKAPKGYKISKGEYFIKVNEDGAVVGDKIIYNSKKKFGRVVLRYKNSIPETKDTNKLFIYLFLFLFGSLSLGIYFKKMNKE